MANVELILVLSEGADQKTVLVTLEELGLTVRKTAKIGRTDFVFVEVDSERYDAAVQTLTSLQDIASVSLNGKNKHDRDP